MYLSRFRDSVDMFLGLGYSRDGLSWVISGCELRL